MRKPSTPTNEAARLEALHGLGIMYTAAEERYDRITRLASKLLDTPIALVTLVDERVQWFKSSQGLAISQTPRTGRRCAQDVLRQELRLDDRRRERDYHTESQGYVTARSARDADLSRRWGLRRCARGDRRVRRQRRASENDRTARRHVRDFQGPGGQPDGLGRDTALVIEEANPSSAGESQQWTDIMIVSRPESRDVPRSRLSGMNEACPSPGQG